ncbi:MAG: protein translocase subunit SecD [Bifidobacteriaceae bacterium]|nr:protein translocase subunit SecD [Bifidobacteriaceae bacterium]
MTLFILIAVLFGAVVVGTFTTDKASFLPGRALDLVGGTQLILQPVAIDSSQRPSTEALNQAVAIIRQRVDASGVAEAEISSEASGNIVVGIPGNPSQEDLDLVSKSAKMTFRSVLREDQATAPSPAAWLTRTYPKPPGDEIVADDSEEAVADQGEDTADEQAVQEGDEPTADETAVEGVAATADGDEVTAAEEEPLEGEEASLEGEEVSLEGEEVSLEGDEIPLDGEGMTVDEDGNLVLDDGSTAADGEEAGPPPTIPPMDDFESRLDTAVDTAIITSDIEDRYANIDCSTVGSDVTGEPSDPDEVLVTCSDAMSSNGQEYYLKYILGPVLVEGDQLANANSGLQTNAQGQTTGEWAVNLQLKTAGARQFSDVSSKLVDLTEPLNQFAIVLDDRVVSAPRINSAIPDGRAEISGSFTQASARTLADQLSFGSLPLNFTVMSQEQVSATLGSEQLQKGLIAGLIGLILVAIYSFMQYRALSFVTVLSLITATGFTYGALLVLSWVQGYRLSLAGVAGVIVSIGVTADSFIVYFERIRDELRDGRVLSQAVELAWMRARRTIIASDAVNFIAAIVLYFVSVGSVRGFAFTLGLTTLMDLLVVMMFTHPMIQQLSRARFWDDGHPWSGLDPYRLGAPGSVHYAGRGRVSRVPDRPRVGAAPARTGKAATAVLERDDDGAPPGSARSPIPKGAPGQSIAERKAAAKAAAAAGQTADDTSAHHDAEEDI